MLIFQKFLFTSLILFLTFSNSVYAAELASDQTTIEKAVVLEILSETTKNISDTTLPVQKLKVKILEGEEKDKVITFDNDYIKVSVGEVFYLLHTEDKFSSYNAYAISDIYRLPVLLFYFVLFLLCVIYFGGIQGIRGLLSLAISLALIAFILLPQILHGVSPIYLSIGISSIVVILGSYITHGFNKTTTSAVIGMIITITFTGFLAWTAVHFARLTGLESEEATYLNLNTHGIVNFPNLLLGSILIGLLGILYDTAITQAIGVEELHKVAPHLPKNIIYKRAIRMGREHIGALVNTLAIAYVGISLPLLLYVYPSYQNDLTQMINNAVFSTEIIRILIGSIGLMMAVPITTAVTVFFIVKKTNKTNAEITVKEMTNIEHIGHHH